MCASCQNQPVETVEEEPVEEVVEETVEEEPVEEVVEETVEEEPVEEVVEETVEEEPVEEVVEETVEEEPVEEVVEETVEEEPVEEVVEETVEEEPVEGVVEETVEEEPVEEVVEETVEEEPVEEVAEETVEEEPAVEEAVSEPTVETEIAVSDAISAAYEEVDDNLVDADTGLVVRLKRSFAAKMKQSDPIVKDYYSQIKNELTSYKRLNANLSWHGDRFNFGRDTVAKINICGKTLCFYLALDPASPEFKTTVYHQKDVSGQKAYEATPFMVKVKSDAALRKSLRLVTALAEKLGTEKDPDFVPVDYVEEYCHESTKQLLEKGLIKVTKEKKVELDF
jgi:hypothetical protein